ncbi:heavy metal-responsive transcriptional regulator [Synechocystis sp. B12]|nr:heavy metal-responsive transcriptional regulator [Synechocystis sp. B12]
MSIMLTVSEVARKLGLNPQTLYFYERIGVVDHPQRNQSGYRVYQEKDLALLSFIRHAKDLGFSLEEIADILHLQSQQSLTCDEIYHKLASKILQLESGIKEMEKMRDDLSKILSLCRQRISNGGKHGNCCLLNEQLT